MVQTYTNRLARETSPYLRQHAENPVDWYPWGADAFEKARKENKPLFVSIGYSTCHWCHVMAHESFENAQTASILNAYFVPVKVDREERPDIDAVYMDATQAMTGSGGWPLSVFMTPEGHPFFCGTYFPPRDIGDRPGFASLLLALHDAWMQKQDEIFQVASQIPLQLAEHIVPDQTALTESLLHNAFWDIERLFDNEFGGFGRSPKFPQPSLLSFLLILHYRTGQARPLSMVEKTLGAMSMGGIHDHLGGGFHRYAVDRKWQVPHFEKMLYDQALISRSFLQAYHVTGRDEYADMARATLDYVLRVLTDSGGGFYSGQDADSEGQEGRFYLWDYDQIMSVLDKPDGDLFAECFGIRPEGNFESRNILFQQKTIRQAAETFRLSLDSAQSILDDCRQKLFDIRQGRVRPHRDEKIIAGWNGLMISALAYGSVVLQKTGYLRAAEQAAHVALQNLMQDGRLRRSFSEGKAVVPAFIEDYAFLAQGLLDLYQACYDPQWLSEGLVLADQMIELFEDKEHGGFFFSGIDAEPLIARQKPHYDASIPSGNSAAVQMLIKAAALSGRTRLFEHAQKTLQLFAPEMQDHGPSMAEMLIGADLYFGPRQEIIVAGSRDNPKTREYLARFSTHFLPRSVLMLRTGNPPEKLLDEINPFIHEQDAIDGTPAAYVCENYACQKPAASPEEFEHVLKTLK